MKHIFLLILLSSALLSTNKTFAQKGPKSGYGEPVTQTQAQFPGGDDSLALFLHRNFQYTRTEKATQKKGQVFVSFTVDRNGKIREPHIVTGATKEIDAETLRVVGLMPDWKPGTSGGTQIDVQYVLPVDYFLSE
jgi:outer membrane biosynthesis protein TonB